MRRRQPVDSFRHSRRSCTSDLHRWLNQVTVWNFVGSVRARPENECLWLVQQDTQRTFFYLSGLTPTVGAPEVRHLVLFEPGSQPVTKLYVSLERLPPQVL